MPDFPSCTGKDVVKALERLGYKKVRQDGSHVRLKCDGRTSLTVPVHHGKDLPKGTLNNIFKNSGFSEEEFRQEL